MAETDKTTNDDSGGGSNSAPARSAADINRAPPDSISGNGQKSGSVRKPSDPTNTSLRRFNPLSNFSSYTYSLTLYMLTPEALNYFTTYGVLPPSQEIGYYVIVAQSGGINNAAEPRGLTNEVGSPPGPGKSGLDYYLEDLSFKTVLLAADGSKTATASTEFTFKVVEPTGFTFFTKLTNSSAQLNLKSKLIQTGQKSSRPNLYQQQYMLGFRFYGYDENGKMVESSEVPNSGQVLGDKYALFQRLMPLTISKGKFNLNGKTTVYSFEATLVHQQAAFGKKFGLMPNQANLQGATIGEIIGNAKDNNNRSLIGWLNSIQQDRKDNENQSTAVVYDVKWVTNKWTNSERIINSPMVVEPSKETAAMTPITRTSESNVKVATKANTINLQSKTINFAGNTPIVSAIDQIIVKSKYITDALNKTVNDRIEASVKENSNGKLTWYSIKPLVTVQGRDDKRNDWVYNITYEIAPFEVPYIKSEYVEERSKYYGPVKAYEYFLTGRNTEVINFEMEYNNLFFVQNPSLPGKDNSSSKKGSTGSSTPSAPSSSVNSSPISGSLNRADFISGSVRASLYSIGDQAEAKIKIIGDPDFIMESIGTETTTESFSKFYGKNNSIDPYGGQLFIEIIFGIAEDYRDNGLLDVGNAGAITFYPEEEQRVLGNRGYIYKIREVTSTFSRGKFE